MTGGEQDIDHVRADESGAARDQDPLHQFDRARKRASARSAHKAQWSAMADARRAVASLLLALVLSAAGAAMPANGACSPGAPSRRAPTMPRSTPWRRG